MTHFLTVLAGTVAIYFALIALVTFGPQVSRKLITAAAAVTLLCGFLFYGFCFSSIVNDPLLAIAQTCYSVFCLFVGESSIDALTDAPLLQTPLFQTVLYTLCFLGIFTTAGTAISAIGSNLLRKMRLYLWRRRPLAIIYSLTPDTLDFARELTEKKYAPLFIDESPDPALMNSAEDMGCVVLSDNRALSAHTGFLRSIGAAKGKRRICLFCLTEDPFENLKYASAFAASAERRGIAPQQTSLTVFAEEDEIDSSLLATKDNYGFGSVLCIDTAQLAARLLMRTAPVWDTISFDSNGKATEDFHALVIGCGRIGQAVIKQLVMNGQFSGSRFSLAVFDPNFEAISGKLHYECGEVFAHYNITPYAFDARSSRMYEYLSENLNQLKYIVVSTGSDHSNAELARQLSHYLATNGCYLPVYICAKGGLRRIDHAQDAFWSIFTSSLLCTDDLDKKAILLNHGYCGNSKRPEENWAECNYFNRMSSRASADYAPAFLKMAGLSQDAKLTDNWVSGELLENMAISEHERWCAFHYCMGFRPMTGEEFAHRCEIYRQKKEADPGSNYRIGKDMAARVHACLIPWEELDDLSARENAVTGKNVDYKAMDRNNVLMLPSLLATEQS